MGNDRGRTGEQDVTEISGGGNKPKKKRGEGIGGKGKALVVFVLVGFLLYMFMADGGISLNKVKRTFNSTPEENLETLVISMKDMEKINKNGGNTLSDIYDKNNLYQDDSAYRLVDKEYIIYVYTGNQDTDAKFNKWVVNNQGKYPVYKLDRASVISQMDMIEYTRDTKTPMLFIFNEVDRGYKVIEEVITSPKDLTKVEGIMNRLVTDKILKE